jgi:hypothetical protein
MASSSAFSEPFFEIAEFSEPSDDDLGPFTAEIPTIKKRMTSKRYLSHMNPRKLEHVLQKPCCTNKCLRNMNLRKMVTDRSEYQRFDERDKTLWIRNQHKISTSLSGQIVLRLQGQV